MPEVYILIIPGFGIISTTISANSNKSVFGYIGINFKHCYYNYFNKSKFSTKSSFDFQDFYSVHKYIDPNWLTWFIGFTEGDGGLHTYNNNKSCLFGLTQKEESILQEVKSVLGFGKVYFDSAANAYRYRVSTKSDILKLAILFNGKFATKNKIDQLNSCINVLNADSVKLTFNPNPFIPTLNDSWLSGFTTAEGSFIVGVVNQKSKKEVIDSEGNMGVKEVISQLVRVRFVLERLFFYPLFLTSGAVFSSPRQSRKGQISLSRISRRRFSSYTRRFSTSANETLPTCNPMWITGFVDGEGAFSVIILKDPLYTLGWKVAAVFSITLHRKDRTSPLIFFCTFYMLKIK